MRMNLQLFFPRCFIMKFSTDWSKLRVLEDQGLFVLFEEVYVLIPGACDRFFLIEGFRGLWGNLKFPV